MDTPVRKGPMLARRLVTGFLAVIVPSVVLLGAVTLYSLTSLARVNRELLELMHSREAAVDLQMTLMQVGAPLGAYLLGGNPANRERFEALVREADEKLLSCASSRCHGSSQTPDRMAEALRPAIERLKAEGRLVFAEGPGGGAARVEAVRLAATSVRAAVEPMLTAVQRRGEELAAEAEAVRRRTLTLTLSLTALVALAGCLAGGVIARRISRPLSDLVSGLRRVMGGDWSYQASAAQPGEIGELATAFNAMVQEVNRHRQTLEEHNRTLEERVRHRTEELRRKEQALQQAERLAALGRLAAGVAHELNNPLTSIVMNANLLMEEVGEGTSLRQELRKIDADAGRCRRIIEDLRSFARLRQIEKVPTTVETVVEQTLAVTAHEVARRAVDVRCDLPPDLPKIACDPDRMVQVLTNLLVNAAQAIGQGGHIAIRARRDRDWLHLEVEDDGAGIPAAHRPRIFDPFFTTKPDGTGLGLSISHGIVSDHGGRLEVESRTREDAEPGAGTGTTVRVILPVAEAPR